MLLQREGPDLALNSRAGSHQICPLLKVDRPCRRAAATSQLTHTGHMPDRNPAAQQSPARTEVSYPFARKHGGTWQ